MMEALLLYAGTGLADEISDWISDKQKRLAKIRKAFVPLVGGVRPI